jgi:hypothetical protein
VPTPPSASPPAFLGPSHVGKGEPDAPQNSVEVKGAPVAGSSHPGQIVLLDNLSPGALGVAFRACLLALIKL